MGNKTVGLLILVVIILSLVTVSILAYPQPKDNDSSDSTAKTTPTPQPTNQPQIQTYTGYLVSLDYQTSQTNGVESTQLFFTNKTFNYAGYVSVDINCVYDVTYYDNNPNQALNVTSASGMSLALTNNEEQITATNPVFASATVVHLTLRNTGASSVTYLTKEQ